jgi:hypothetical protein
MAKPGFFENASQNFSTIENSSKVRKTLNKFPLALAMFFVRVCIKFLRSTLLPTGRMAQAMSANLGEGANSGFAPSTKFAIIGRGQPLRMILQRPR